MNAPLSGRVAVVTGASAGIGAAIGRRLAADGATVALLARRADRLNEVVESIAAAGGRAVAVSADVTDAAAVAAAATEVNDQLGNVNLLVNNAGVASPSALSGADAASWLRELDVNVTGLWQVTAAFLPALIKSAADGPANLVNISSVFADSAAPMFASYAATKAAVTHWSEQARTELSGHNIRVTAIEPGLVASEFVETVVDENIQGWIREQIAAGNSLTPEDIAELVSYVAAAPPHVTLAKVRVVAATA